MSATLAMKNVKVKAFGNAVDVPDNAIARLMYYLHCVSTVIDYHDSTLTDYENYDELTDEQLAAVYGVAKVLDPSLFIEAGIFIVNPTLIFNGLDNQFFEITDETIGIHINERFEISGQKVKVLKVMVCNDNWIRYSYDTPMKIIDNFIREMESRRYSQQVINTQTTITQEPQVLVINVEFKGDPVSMACPYCQNMIKTKTKSTCNCLACICCLLFNLFYCGFQLCAKKNVFCCNVAHICPLCGATLGHFDAC